MNYAESIAYIEDKASLGIVPGLDNILDILQVLGNPEQRIPAIHIAGTNGKGSIMSFVESVLLESGYRVGRYISPAIREYRERWTVDRQMPPETEVAELMTEIREAEKQIPGTLTAFETETALAFLLFSRRNCDIQLIECGMGGRLDATNVLPKKVLDILASVSMDHMQFLGNTRGAILKEKLGIVKAGDALVTAPMDPELRREMDSLWTEYRETDLSRVSQVSMTVDGTDFCFGRESYHLQMPGDVALENAATALTALEQFNERAEAFGLRPVTRAEKEKGLAGTAWPARFTVLRHQPTVILDGAHNRDAWKRLAETLRRFYPDKKLNLVLGVLRDKEVECLVEEMAPLAKSVLTFTPDSPRALSGKELAERFTSHFEKAGEEVPVMPTEGAFSGLLGLMEQVSPDEVILVCGSLTFTGEILDGREDIEMHRVTRILRDPEYRQQMKKIISAEYKREYCRHGLGHSTAVARIAYILSMEEGIRISKELLYATALLHDIGRYTEEEKQMSHHEAGAVFADRILERTGFSQEERKRVFNAIRKHKSAGQETDPLADLLYRADKLSRSCFFCDVRESCYWPEERKNQTIRC